jgi:hypothetical protein
LGVVNGAGWDGWEESEAGGRRRVIVLREGGRAIAAAAPIRGGPLLPAATLLVFIFEERSRWIGFG